MKASYIFAIAYLAIGNATPVDNTGASALDAPSAAGTIWRVSLDDTSFTPAKQLLANNKRGELVIGAATLVPMLPAALAPILSVVLTEDTAIAVLESSDYSEE